MNIFYLAKWGGYDEWAGLDLDATRTCSQRVLMLYTAHLSSAKLEELDERQGGLTDEVQLEIVLKSCLLRSCGIHAVLNNVG